MDSGGRWTRGRARGASACRPCCRACRARGHGRRVRDRGRDHGRGRRRVDGRDRRRVRGNTRARAPALAAPGRASSAGTCRAASTRAGRARRGPGRRPAAAVAPGAVPAADRLAGPVEAVDEEDLVVHVGDDPHARARRRRAAGARSGRFDVNPGGGVRPARTRGRARWRSAGERRALSVIAVRRRIRRTGRERQGGGCRRERGAVACRATAQPPGFLDSRSRGIV